MVYWLNSLPDKVKPRFQKRGFTFHNCVNCSVATDATLSGNPASALPINHNNGVLLSVLEKNIVLNSDVFLHQKVLHSK